MGLFATLTSSAAEAGKTTTRSSSSEVPCMVQLYSKSPITLISRGGSGSSSSKGGRKFSILSYQAVHVGAATEGSGGALLSSSSKQDHVPPNLGVWNFRVTKPKSGTAPITDDVFAALPKSTTCFGISVSMDNLSQVESTISMLQDALVRYLIGSSSHKPSPEKPPAATTTLYQLRSTFFGLADNDKGSAERMQASSKPDDQDKNVHFSLIITVAVPSSNNNKQEAYKEKQAEALVLYHLRKYAASLNAVLCFVRTDDPTALSAAEEDTPNSSGNSNSPNNSIEAISLRQLSHVWQKIAKGEEGWKDFDSSKSSTGGPAGEEGAAAEETEDQAAAVVSSTSTGVYGPGSQQEDLIESVLLRNAHFPGQWDASNVSLWAALPKDTTEDADKTAASANGDGAGDEGWLRELRSSVSSEVVKTPPAKGDPASAAKTPNDAELSSFFDSLLKP